MGRRHEKKPGAAGERTPDSEALGSNLLPSRCERA
jgi:hypothetical protein